MEQESFSHPRQPLMSLSTHLSFLGIIPGLV